MNADPDAHVMHHFGTPEKFTHLFGALERDSEQDQPEREAIENERQQPDPGEQGEKGRDAEPAGQGREHHGNDEGQERDRRPFRQ